MRKPKYYGSGLPLGKTKLPRRPGLGPSARVLRAGASFVSEMSGLLNKLCVLFYIFFFVLFVSELTNITSKKAYVYDLLLFLNLPVTGGGVANWAKIKEHSTVNKKSLKIH